MNKSGKQKSTFGRLLSYIIRNSRLMFITVCIAVVLSTAANVLGSMFTQVVIDDYITPLLSVTDPDYSGLLKAIISMGCIYIIGIVCTIIYNRMMVTISQGCLKHIRDDMFYHMQSLPIKYFDTHTHGDVMSHYTNDTDTLRQFISNALAQLIACVITAVVSFVVMVYYSRMLALIVVAVTAIDAVITFVVSKKSISCFSNQQAALANVNGYIEEMLNGQKVIKIFCREKQSKEDFVKKNRNLYENSVKANTLANLIMPTLGQIGNLLTVTIAFVGGLIILNGNTALTAGIVVAFLSLTKSFSNPIQQVGQQISLITMALAGAKRIFALLDEESEIDEGYVTLVNARKNDKGEITECDERTGMFAWKHPHGNGSVTYTELKGDIRMYDVDFGYTAEKVVLHGITLYAEPGQKLSFVGATGAGKTTITNLLNRFYDIADGKIRYDGININKIKKDDLRRSIGLVLQDTNLFTDTVLENIRYGRLDATDDECFEAAKLSGADSFISNLPDGYNTVLMNAGASLSQGQRQLLNISRAVAANPPCMILDEATSSIDTRTERIVQEGMDALMKGRTSFVIAHRLSTIQNSDVIMVLDHGNIIERGSHEKLIDEKGTYYQLYTGAFELE